MPDEQPEIGDIDFAGEMHHLAYEAQLKAAPRPPGIDRKELMMALGQMVRPLALELENIKRATSENGVLLTGLGKAAQKPLHGEPDPLERISQQLERVRSVDTANQKLFDALHTELKGYKDNFLFDALQRPFIRDLVAIFDDFSAVHAQISKRLAASRTALDGGEAAPQTPKAPIAAADPARQSEADFLGTLAGNVENQVHHLLEVFLRMEVVLSQSPPGTSVDKKQHRTVAFEPAPCADEDARVVRSLKPGFTWRERMIRPEDVVVYRWMAGTPPLPPERTQPSPEPKTVPASADDRAVADAKNSKPK
jgi:molecular chaperone GrpE (heat shock protein)